MARHLHAFNDIQTGRRHLNLRAAHYLLLAGLLPPATILLGDDATLADDVNPAADVFFEDCSIGTAGLQLPAQCTTLEVPLDPANPALGMQQLSVAKIQSRRRSNNTDALTLLAGGPGQSAIESFPAVSFAFRHIMQDRDLILIDQRGTGESTALKCPEDTDAASLNRGVSPETDPQEIATLAAACLAQLPADPQWFTTSVAVQDLENVRLQLGISQWNLYGVSYGTRVAMHYLRRFPSSVRTVVLDAVVPPQVSLGPDIAPLAQQALEHIFNRCESDTGCFEAFGNLTAPTLALLDDLGTQPRTITYEDVATGQLTTREFTREHLAITLRLMSYSSQTAAILPSMLFDAIENDNLAPFARQSDMQNTSLGNTLSTGMHHAVICSEDAPFFDQQLLDRQAAASDQPNYLGDDIVDAIRATCSRWPAGVIDDDFKQPVVSDKPTLILSGGADPVTPPSYGNQVAESLSHVRHIVNDEQGHMQAIFGCTPVLLAQFIDSADATALNTDCLQRISPTPFFVDANGPLP